MPKFIDLTNQPFGRLKALSFRRVGCGRYLWLCQCECGNTVEVSGGQLRSSCTQSCGCLQRERAAEAKTKHGMSRFPEHHVWTGMIDRCYRKGAARYKYYGERGITVCNRWRESFANFYADMGPRPSPKHSIDRYPDQDGNYEPGNCRWATQAEQVRNTSRTILIACGSETLCLKDWAGRLGVAEASIRKLHRQGLRGEELLRPFFKAVPRNEGGTRIGSGSANSKMTEASVAEDRAAYACGGVKIEELANRRGVSKSVMAWALRGDTWKHVSGAVHRVKVDGKWLLQVDSPA